MSGVVGPMKSTCGQKKEEKDTDFYDNPTRYSNRPTQCAIALKLPIYLSDRCTVQMIGVHSFFTVFMAIDLLHSLFILCRLFENQKKIETTNVAFKPSIPIINALKFVNAIDE